MHREDDETLTHRDVADGQQVALACGDREKTWISATSSDAPSTVHNIARTIPNLSSPFGWLCWDGLDDDHDLKSPRRQEETDGFEDRSTLNATTL